MIIIIKLSSTIILSSSILLNRANNDRPVSLSNIAKVNICLRLRHSCKMYLQKNVFLWPKTTITIWTTSYCNWGVGFYCITLQINLLVRVAFSRGPFADEIEKAQSSTFCSELYIWGSDVYIDPHIWNIVHARCAGLHFEQDLKPRSDASFKTLRTQWASLSLTRVPGADCRATSVVKNPSCETFISWASYVWICILECWRGVTCCFW